MGITEDEYPKFKSLLEYFVAHIEYCVNKKEETKGYQKYIAKINDFRKSGQGHKGAKIQNQIQGWAKYQNGTICINVNATTFQGRGTYLNWQDTAINVIAIWRDDAVINLKIVKDSYPISNSKDVLENTLTELGLFDNNEPNDNLKTFFDTYNSLIIKRNKDKQNEKDMEQTKLYIDLLKSCKNLIFTGAPGTGKTYLAREIARQMIGVTTDEELEKSGQFAFVQFHPSYDYTDFVEGLRPTKPDGNGNIGFELRDGVFKKFCKRASENLMDSKKSSEELQQKSDIETTLDNFLIDAIENEIEFDYKKNTNKFVIIPHPREEDCFYAKILNNESMERQLVAKEDVIKALEKANEIHKPTDVQKLFNTRFKYQYTFIFLILERLRNKLKTKTTQSVAKIEEKDFIFIIDEINRGEISKIFGELFFSIDPGYRGKKGAAATQYFNMHETNEMFYVPENVFIIGTMNDIDRSVESFDFAMRRRFVWQEITAEESAENMPLSDTTKNRMKNLNSAISGIHGLNSSYHIGGAYFLDVKGGGQNDYDKIWRLRLRPLLFEYLRGMPESEADKLDKDLKLAYENDR